MFRQPYDFLSEKCGVVCKLRAADLFEFLEKSFDGQLLFFFPANVKYDAAVVHHYEAVAVFDGVLHIVRYHEGGKFVFMNDLVAQRQHVRSGFRVERRSMFVKEQHLRFSQRCHKKRDCLTLTASAQQEGAVQTLEALSRCKRELGVRTVLGVSNISFGLPCRGYLNTTFLTMAMSAGLDLAIMNPNTPEMMAAVRAYRVLTSQDLQSTDYVAAYADVQIQTTQTSKSAATVAEVGAAAPGGDALFEAVRRGLKAEARAAADAALTMREPLDVVNVSLIPALDAVGDGFEKGTVFLPQLLQAATAAQAAFEAIKAKIAASGQAQGSKGKIVIATVKGDVHDIGKNIVRVILENYGYDVLDLGRDVDPERVVEAVRQTGAKLVGLSALMTTTVPNMQATIEALHAAHLDCKVMVGGAVLTPDYARDIGADYYCKDAKASADLAKQLLG